RWIHDEFGYQIILWDVDPNDWKRPGPAVVRTRILKETRPGSIVLSHDIHPGTIEAMPSTFDALEAKGFKFVTVSELIRTAVAQPWARRHIANFDKLPIGHVGWREPEIIAHGRGNIQAGSMVQVWLRPFILEHILEVIRAKGAAIFPLRVASAIPLSNGDPAI